MIQTKVEQYVDHYRVYTAVDGAAYWGVGVDFPTEEVASWVAKAIVAATDPRHVRCEGFVLDGVDTDGTEWFRCTTHDELKMGDDPVVCGGYRALPYVEPSE